MKTSQFNELEMFMCLIIGNQNHGWMATVFYVLGILSFIQGLVNVSNGN